MADGHWVTINGNHVFIEDSSSGKVLKGRVEKTEPPIPNGDGGDRTPNGGGHSGGGGGSGGGNYPPDKKKPIWDFLKKIAPLVISEIFGNDSAFAKSSSNFPKSNTRIPQYKAQVDNVVQQAKTSLSQEYDKIQKMIKDVSAMPKGEERDSKWQEVLSKGAEIDEAKSIISNIEAYNNHDMPEKIVDELNKLSDALPQNYIKSLQSLGAAQKNNQKYLNSFSGKSEPVDFGDKAKLDFAKGRIPEFIGHFIYPNTTEFAHNSLNWFKDANKNPDAIVLDSVKDVSNTELRTYLQNKIPETLHNKADSKGVFYSDNSNIAKIIANSNDFRNVLLENRTELLKNNKITLKPVRFNNDKDLKNSLHNATVYKAWIDQNGNLHAIITDIYDFDYLRNRTDDIAKINNQMYYWQNHNNIENYFVIIYVTIDKNDGIFQIFRW